MMKMPTAMPVMARAGYSQRVHDGTVGVPGVLAVAEAVSVIALPFLRGWSSGYPVH